MKFRIEFDAHDDLMVGIQEAVELQVPKEGTERLKCMFRNQINDELGAWMDQWFDSQGVLTLEFDTEANTCVIV